jgi:cadmium resistance protein CadD (predicted permease)
MNEIIIGVFTLMGVLIGTFLQFLSSKYLNSNDFKRRTEFETYVDYLKTIAGIKTAQKTDNVSEYINNLTRLIEVKSRILIVGSYKTIESLKKFEEHGAIISDNYSKELFSDIIVSMREALGDKKKLDFETVNAIILGKQKNGA